MRQKKVAWMGHGVFWGPGKRTLLCRRFGGLCGGLIIDNRCGMGCGEERLALAPWGLEAS